MNNPFLLPTNSPFVKICGLNDEECVDAAVGSGADAVGFVFAPNSPRLITRELANQLVTQVPDDVLSIAVLQDFTSLSDFNDWNGWLQLCGNEDEQIIASSPCPVIKAFTWDREQLLRWDACPDVQALLVDGSTGGKGVAFDVEELASLMPSVSKPVIIAGGLNAQNVAQAIQAARPAGVDVSSGVESSLGNKDPVKICEFIHAVKNLQ